MNVRIEGPLSSVAGLGELADLYGELHEVHATVAMYGPLIRDAAASWQLRQCLYEGAVRADVAVYFVARDEFDRAIGYAVVLSAPGPDDTFETRGMLELVSLVVSAEYRNRGLGRRLVAAVEDHARSIGADTVKVAVMAGNSHAEALYADLGFRLGELLFYKRLE